VLGNCSGAAFTLPPSERGLSSPPGGHPTKRPRGFSSILGSKGGMKVTSTRREDGARVYEA